MIAPLSPLFCFRSVRCGSKVEGCDWTTPGWTLMVPDTLIQPNRRFTQIRDSNVLSCHSSTLKSLEGRNQPPWSSADNLIMDARLRGRGLYLPCHVCRCWQFSPYTKRQIPCHSPSYFKHVLRVAAAAANQTAK